MWTTNLVNDKIFLLLDAKRMIGRKFDDAALQKDIKLWPFKVISVNSKPKVEVKYKVV